MKFERAYLAALVGCTSLFWLCASLVAQGIVGQHDRAYNVPLSSPNELSDASDVPGKSHDDIEINRLSLQMENWQQTMALPSGHQVLAQGPSTGSVSRLATNERQQEAILTPASADSQPNAPTGAANSNVPVMSDGYEVGTDKNLITTWNNGFEAKSKHGDFRFRVGGLLQFDTSWLDTDSALLVPPASGGIGSNPDSMQLRRARIAFEGTYYEVFDFKFEFDLANFVAPAAPSAGQPVVSTPAETELWVQWTHLPILGTVRAGNQKEPLGLEHVESIKYLSFIEPSYLFDMVFGPFNLGFSPGVQVLNWSEDQDWTWQYGVFGNNTDGFGYSIDNDWAATARTTYLLWYDEPSQGRYMWDVGISGSVRTPDEDFVRLRTRGNIRSGPPGVLNPIYADTGNLGSDEQDIIAVETFAQYGAWSLQGEYAGTWVQDAVQLSSATNRGTPFFHGGYIELLYFLTRDCRTYNKQIAAPDWVVPMENAFLTKSGDGCCSGYGAWQIGLRYSAIDLNDNGINGGILNSGTLGLNWFANPNTIVQFNYDLTHRSDVSSTHDGFINGFGTRVAFNF